MTQGAREGRPPCPVRPVNDWLGVAASAVQSSGTSKPPCVMLLTCYTKSNPCIPCLGDHFLEATNQHAYDKKFEVTNQHSSSEKLRATNELFCTGNLDRTAICITAYLARFEIASSYYTLTRHCKAGECSPVAGTTRPSPKGIYDIFEEEVSLASLGTCKFFSSYTSMRTGHSARKLIPLEIHQLPFDVCARG